MPTLETSSLPSLRRPIATDTGFGTEVCARARVVAPPMSGVAARLAADTRKVRRAISLLISAPSSVRLSKCVESSALSSRPIRHDDGSGELHEHQRGIANDGDSGGATEALPQHAHLGAIAIHRQLGKTSLLLGLDQLLRTRGASSIGPNKWH